MFVIYLKKTKAALLSQGVSKTIFNLCFALPKGQIRIV
jgi:hypothetical protein